jgi:hypothetical protein
MTAPGLAPLDPEIASGFQLSDHVDDGGFRFANRRADGLAGREARAAIHVEIFVGHVERDGQTGDRWHVGVIDHDGAKPRENLCGVLLARLRARSLTLTRVACMRRAHRTSLSGIGPPMTAKIDGGPRSLPHRI